MFDRGCDDHLARVSKPEEALDRAVVSLRTRSSEDHLTWTRPDAESDSLTCALDEISDLSTLMMQARRIAKDCHLRCNDRERTRRNRSGGGVIEVDTPS
jgi:hypothetical protein